MTSAMPRTLAWPLRGRGRGETHLSLYDGTMLLGHITERNGRCTASTWPDERHLGEFRNRKAAANAISAAHAEMRK
jgi:hypothetical protein